MKQSLSILSEPTTPLAALRKAASAVPYYGRGRYCPLCERSSRRFRPFGRGRLRPDAQCPHCSSLERHRFVWLYFQHRTDLFNGVYKRVLHVAPEACLEPPLRAKLGDGYLTADLHHEHAMVKMDITRIDYPAASFDVIYCSHVLEHVEDDAKALAEFRRVLHPNGWAILLVPITSKTTVEDPTIKEPAARLKAFGREDHVRSYGPDYVERLEAAGFDVNTSGARNLVTDEEAAFMGLTSASGYMYFCRPRA